MNSNPWHNQGSLFKHPRVQVLQPLEDVMIGLASVKMPPRTLQEQHFEVRVSGVRCQCWQELEGQKPQEL